MTGHNQGTFIHQKRLARASLEPRCVHILK